MISYNPLWKLLIDRKLKKTELRKAIGISMSTLAKMGKNEYVSMDVINRICEYLKVQPGDIIEYIEEKERKN